MFPMWLLTDEEIQILLDRLESMVEDPDDEYNAQRYHEDAYLLVQEFHKRGL